MMKIKERLCGRSFFCVIFEGRCRKVNRMYASDRKYVDTVFHSYVPRNGGRRGNGIYVIFYGH